MKYTFLEKPNIYESVLSFDVFNYSDELILETQLFSLDVVKLNPLGQFKDKESCGCKVLIYGLNIETEDIDFDEIVKIIRQECFEMESIDVFISVNI